MLKTKTLSALACAALVFGLASPSTLAAEGDAELYLPDVENLVVEAGEASAILNWDAVDGADAYSIYYGLNSITEDGGAYEENVLTENVTEYTVEELTPGTTYYFAVAAEDSTSTYLGSFSYSNEAIVVPLEVTVAATETEDEVAAAAVAEAEAAAQTETETTAQAEADAAAAAQAEADAKAAAETEAEAEQNLPQSGPGVAIALLASTVGAYFWRKRKAE